MGAGAARTPSHRQQVGYKLKALLLYERNTGGVRFFLFGDDSERDATPPHLR